MRTLNGRPHPDRNAATHTPAERTAAIITPAPDEFSDPAVATGKPGCLELGIQLQGRAPVPFGTAGIGFQGFDPLSGKRLDLARRTDVPVLRFKVLRLTQSALDGVPAPATATRYLRNRQLITVVPTTNSCQFLHGDHLHLYPTQKVSGRG